MVSDKLHFLCSGSLIFTVVHFEPTTKGIVTHLAFTALTQNINWFSDQMFHSCEMTNQLQQVQPNMHWVEGQQAKKHILRWCIMAFL